VTNEEIERTMQFILEQQAQFATNIQKLEETQLRDSPRLQRLEDAFVQLVDLARTTDERLDAISTSQSRLEDVQTRLAEAQARTESRLAELADAQARTESTLVQLADAQARAETQIATLVATVDQYIKLSGNGSK
jgi:predicted nuclease with TOPRIM domain